jgi:hypothetical protein
MLFDIFTSCFKPARPEEGPSYPMTELALAMPDIILTITDRLSLADLTALALVNKFFYSIIELPDLNLPDNVHERIDFLTRFRDFDSNPAKILCMVCGKYHTWKEHRYDSQYRPDWSPGLSLCGRIDPVRDIKVDSTISIPGTAIQLRMRALDHLTLANIFRRKKYGTLDDRSSPLKFLTDNFEHNISYVEHWRHVSMLRINSEPLPTALVSVAAFRAGPIPSEIANMLCNCNDTALSRDIVSDFEDAMACRARGPETCSRMANCTSSTGRQSSQYELPRECRPPSGEFRVQTVAGKARRCQSCKMLVRVELFYWSWLGRVQPQVLSKYTLLISRYHDLGPVASHSMNPEDFARRFPKIMVRKQYGLSPSGRWLHSSTESDQELCESMSIAKSSSLRQQMLA